MSIDFPRAWELAAGTEMSEHHPDCSYRQTNRALICDCDVLYRHPETLDEAMHTRGGVIYKATVNPAASGG